jgi:ferric-dicitrate binding protein FerR (iron transport regulator)
VTSRRLLACLALLLAAAQAPAADWTYTVRPNDSLWTLAERYCGSTAFAPRIAAANGLSDASQLRAGTRLRIPVAWLVRQPVSASITAVRGDVMLLQPAPRQAQVGDEVEMGQILRTGAGTAAVTFGDGSSLELAAESEVLFNILTAYGDTGMVDTNLRFYRGRATSRIIRRNDGSSFRISTPTGTAAVRGTNFRVGVSPGQTLTETLTGEVGFEQDQVTVLPAGFGAVAGTGGVQREALLPAPEWVPPAGNLSSSSRVAWLPLAEARGYRVEVFAAADPQTPLRSVTLGEPPFELAGLTPGDYRLTVRGRSASGLEGFERDLPVRLQHPAPSLLPTGQVASGTAPELAWQAGAASAPYEVEIATAADFADASRSTAQDTRFTAPPLPPGRYVWRVRGADGVFSEAAALVVVPADVTGLSLDATPQTLTATWQPGAAVTSYRVSVAANTGAWATTEITTEPRLELPVPMRGNYTVTVVALTGDLASNPAQAVAKVPSPPLRWPIPLSLFLVMLLAL